MQVLQIPKNIRPLFISLPPMYTWPTPLKRVILTLAASACLGVYILLLGGLLGATVVLLELVLD